MFTPSLRGEASKKIIKHVTLRDFNLQHFLRPQLLVAFEVAMRFVDAVLQALDFNRLSAVDFVRNVQLGERGCRSRSRSVEAAAKR